MSGETRRDVSPWREPPLTALAHWLPLSCGVAGRGGAGRGGAERGGALHLAHDLGITPCQVVVDRDEVAAALACKSVEVNGAGARE